MASLFSVRRMSSSRSEAAAILFDLTARKLQMQMQLYPGRDDWRNRSSLRRLIRELARGLGLRDHPLFGCSDGRVGFPQRCPLWVIARTYGNGIIIFVVVVARPLEEFTAI